MRRFIAIDLETSGLDPFEHEIIEVGLVIELVDTVAEVVEIREFETSLPFDETKAQPEALEVNGWGKRPFPPQRPPEYVAGFLQDVLADAHLVGKNPWFDARFVEALLRQYSLKPSWHHRMIDIGSLAWGWDCGTLYQAGYPERVRQQPPNVDAVEEILNIPVGDNRHAAIIDARWAYETFRKVVPRP